MGAFMTYDQHYTPEHISKELSEIIIERYGMEATYVEPSEGNGSFSKHFPTVIGYDIDPVLDTTIKADFLTIDPVPGIYIGNPPFGYKGRMAIDFFNHAAKSADAICFIMPRSIKKPRLQQQINPYWHVVCEKDIDSVFEHTDTRCTFQIWEPRSFTRTRNTTSNNSIATISDNPTHYLVRVGSKIDIVSTENNPSINRRYGIHITRPEMITPDLIKTLNQHAVLNSSNVKSISLDDVNRLMENIMTIKTKIIKQLLIQPYDFSAFDRGEITTIDPDELKVLQTTLSTFTTDVINYQAQLREEEKQNKSAKLETLKDLLSTAGLSIDDFKDLVSTDSITVPKTKNQVKTQASSYRVVFQGKEYKTANKKLPAALLKNGAYQALIKSSQEYQDIEVFLREHSNDYRKAFPLNAHYNSQEFHVNLRGKLNSVAMKYFNLYLKKNPGKTEKDFKMAVLK